jgi:16S rRNA (guanine1207-N2)-methyltransferase
VSSDHYFTADPASDGELRGRTVELAGAPVQVLTAGGVFSPHGLDKGTAVLLRSVPPPPAQGTFLDLGCGWGPLALTLGLESPGARVYAVDVNRRAVDLARRNAERLGCAGIVAREPDDVPDDVTFDLIWSNPPIRVGKAALHDLLRRWLPRLAEGGTAYLVVGRNLGADSLQTWLAATFPDLTVGRASSAKGFRVLRVEA